jgi:LacI family transcriptional regulator, galactose operon repressor
MKDVAIQLGVSISTVSRALNDNPALSAKTIEKVREAVERSTYIRNNVARGLALRRSHLIGLIASDISNPFFAEISRGAHDVARQKSYLLTLANTGRKAEKEEELSKTLLENQVEGLIFAGGTMGEEHLCRLRARGVPFVVAGRWSELASVPTVTVDNVAIGYQATKYMIEIGHEKIMFLSGPADSGTSQQRRQGYCHAMRAHGLLPMEAAGDFRMETGFSVASQLLSKKKRPKAIFAANDLMAVGLILGLTNVGIRVPEDISVIGCDDIPIARLIKPSLTTIKVPMYEIGCRAMEILVALLEGRQGLTSQASLLGSELVVRDSTSNVLRVLALA